MRDYIIKLNDRNLQRKKASGITNYVMYSLIFLIVFKIFDLIPKVNGDVDVLGSVEVIWYTLNLAFAVYFIYLSFLASFSNSSSIRILRYSKDNDSYFIKILIVITLLSPVVPGIITLYYRYSSEELRVTFLEKPLIIMDFLNVLFVLGVLIVKNKDRLDIFRHTKKDKHDGLSKTAFAVSVLVIFAALSSLIHLEKLREVDKLNLFTITLMCFAILVIFEKIIERYKYDIFARDLENLEYEIFVKDLSDKEVRVILQKKYMGFLINDYLELKQEELDKKEENFQEQENFILNKQEELKNVEKETYPIEYRGREKEISSLKRKLKLERIDFFDEQQSELREIIRKDSNLSVEALDKIRDMVKDIYLKLEKLKSPS